MPFLYISCNALKVSKKVCDEVNGTMVGFWWGQQQDEMKIHWTSWLSLTKRNEKMGFGFKDLNLRNVALLAKQCWRIINNPEAMWVRIVKDIYFCRCLVLEAKKCAKASWAWTSILKGMDFFNENMMWQIINGEKVNILRDKWIPNVCLQGPRGTSKNG